MCVCGLCNVCVCGCVCVGCVICVCVCFCVCVDFLMGVCVCVGGRAFLMCGYFGNMCTFIYCFVLFVSRFCVVSFICILCYLPPSENSIAVNNNNNNNNNSFEAG